MKFALLIIFTALMSTSAIAERLTGQVVGVADGDTVTVLTAGDRQVKIRLAEIDAPEMKQAHGEASKKMLSNLVFQKSVDVDWTERDRYGRIVGTIYIGQWSVNAKMVAIGGAWAYRKYLHHKSLLDYEREARNRKIGLWALQADQIMPPWDWRERKRK